MTSLKLVERSTPKAQKAAPKKPAKALKRQVAAAAGVGLVASALTALSLDHLAHGIEIVTNSPAWQCWAMAVGVDLGFMSLEAAQLLCASDKIRKEISRWTRWAIPGTLAGSALLNAFAFCGNATGWHAYIAAAIGLSVPALIYSMMQVGAKLYLDGSARG